ncbi:MAG TPA: 30S ribosomal protein S16 [Chitinophagales bacterium]|nr:30S ribosomal protein S16 [Chitinophagales bacterium]
MPVKIRLQRHGKKKAPWFTIVVANSRSPRDGKYIERLGTYDPTTIPATITIDNDKALTWMNKGAQPTDTVRRILSYKGVLYKKHLERGVKKSVLSPEKADQLYKEFIEKREDQIRRHREEQLNKEKRLKEARKADEVKKREAMEAKRKLKVEEAPATEAPAEVTGDTAAAEVRAAAESPVAETPSPEQQAAPETPAGEQPQQ